MKFWRYGQVKAFIKAYRGRGFFQIRFPGGTSWNGEINSVIIVAVFDSDGKLYFLVIPYDSKSNLENKDVIKKENQKTLAVRKLKEETGLIAQCFDLKVLLRVIVDDNRLNKLNKKHTKYFYLLEKFSGELVNRENSSFLDSETATPFLVPAPLLAKELFYGHLRAYEAAINELSNKMQKEDLYATRLALSKREKSNQVAYERNKKKFRVAGVR